MEYDLGDLGEDRNMCRFNCCPYWDFEQEKCIYTSCKRLINELKTKKFMTNVLNAANYINDNSKRDKAHFIYV